MLQIPKNVMQIGEINAHTKIYMEDYVHTFLERRREAEEYLAFGKKEERSDVTVYLIYGVERKRDWNRGSFPYFKKYERIGTIEGAPGKRAFRPVRGSAVSLNGYFVFYEQNEDMQSYMIVMRETESAGGSEEKEEVLEAVRKRREKRAQDTGVDSAAARQHNEDEGPVKSDVQERDKKERVRIAEQFSGKLKRKAAGNAVKAGKNRRDKRAEKMPRSLQRTARGGWSFPDLCRAGSLILMLVIAVLGITSVNRYPDMKAVMQMFSEAAKTVMGSEENSAGAPPEEGLVVEEAGERIQWTVGQNTVEMETGESTEVTETSEEEQNVVLKAAETPEQGETQAQAEEDTQGIVEVEETLTAESEDQTEAERENQIQEEPEEEATQALARPDSYVVKRGDSLAEIARRFYGDTAVIKEICAVNNIEDPDQIHAGQNILLP